MGDVLFMVTTYGAVWSNVYADSVESMISFDSLVEHDPEEELNFVRNMSSPDRLEAVFNFRGFLIVAFSSYVSV